jgi:hypothetical protein
MPIPCNDTQFINPCHLQLFECFVTHKILINNTSQILISTKTKKFRIFTLISLHFHLSLFDFLHFNVTRKINDNLLVWETERSLSMDAGLLYSCHSNYSYVLFTYFILQKKFVNLYNSWYCIRTHNIATWYTTLKPDAWYCNRTHNIATWYTTL